MPTYAQVDTQGDVHKVTGLLVTDSVPMVLPPDRFFVEVLPEHGDVKIGGAVTSKAVDDDIAFSFSAPPPPRATVTRSDFLLKLTPRQYFAITTSLDAVVVHALAVFNASTWFYADDAVLATLLAAAGNAS